MPRLTLRPQSLMTLPPGPDGARMQYHDTEARGLLLRVGGPDKRDRVFYFRYNIKGRTRRMRLGDLTGKDGLTEMRAKARALRSAVDAGRDPMEEKEEAERKKEGAETFAELGKRALTAFETRLRPKTTDEWRRIWNKEIVPHMGDVDPTDAKTVKREVYRITDALVAAGKKYGANRCFELARRVMSFAVATDRDDRYLANPLFRLEKPFLDEKPRKSKYTDDEIRGIVAGAAGTLYANVVPLLLATGCRAGETLAAEWSEFDGNTWNIPAAKSKIDHDRPVALSKLALEILKPIRERTGDGMFLFPAHTKSGHQERSQKVIYRIRKASSVADFELHDLRRVVRSGLTNLGIRTDVAELCIGHLPPTMVRSYAGHPDFWQLDEQRKAMEKWGARLATILSGEEHGADVVAITARRPA